MFARAPADDTLVYDPDTDQLLEDGLYTYAYDDNGNRVGKTRKSDGVTTTYKYDAFDRLIYVGIDSDDPYPPTSALGSRVYYAYDWAGRLARRISGCKADLDSLGGMYQAADVCVVTRYAYDGLNLAAEYAEDGSPLVIYNHAPGSIDRPVSMQIEGAVFYFHYDERGSVTHITNGFGHIVQRYVYDSFGRIVLQQGALPNAFTYTGRHWDAVARLYHYRARAYDPDTGSFLQHDPIPAANPYAYTDNDPVNFTDPLGLSKKGCEWKKFVNVNRNVCYGVKSDRCGPKCYKELKGSCATSEAPDGFKLWKDAWYSRCGCTKCVKIANTPSCEEICNGMPDTNTCIAQCKENKSKAQDNQGAGKNDGEPGEDVTTAPDDKDHPLHNPDAPPRSCPIDTKTGDKNKPVIADNPKQRENTKPSPDKPVIRAIEHTRSECLYNCCVEYIENSGRVVDCNITNLGIEPYLVLSHCSGHCILRNNNWGRTYRDPYNPYLE